MRYALLAWVFLGCLVCGCARNDTDFGVSDDLKERAQESFARDGISDDLKKRVLVSFACRAFDVNGRAVGIFTFEEPGILGFDFDEGITGEIPLYAEFIEKSKTKEFQTGFCCAGYSKVFEKTGVLFCAHDGYECLVDLKSGRGFLRVPIMQGNGNGGVMASGDGQYLSLQLIDAED